MTWEKTFIRNTLFVAVAAAVFLCTGCFTATVLLDPEFGSRSTYFGTTTYTMSPDRREIIVTSTKTTGFHYGISFFSMRFLEFLPSTTLWSWRSTWEERIPVDPMPDGLMRCFLFVESAPDAQPYWFHSRGGFEIETDGIPLCEDKTYYLRVRPDELGILSRPFVVQLIPREGEQPEEDATAESGQESPQDEEAGPPEKKPDDDRRIMFPVGIYGNMYVLLTVAPREPRPNPIREWKNKGRRAPPKLREYAESMWDTHEEVRYLYPFREAQEEILLTEYERLIRVRPLTPDAILWKSLCLPPAIVADTLLLPYYVVGGTCALLLIMTVGSAIQ